MTFPPGNSLRPFADSLRNLRAAITPVGMGEVPRDVQDSPFVARSNLMNLRNAINNIPREILAEALADILAARFGKARASLVLRDALEIVEAVK